MSNRKYNITIGIILLWGFLVNAILCIGYSDVFMSWNPLVVLIGYFVSAIIGICMSSFSDNPLISFIGYNLVVLPIGIVLSIELQNYYANTIVQAIFSALVVTILIIIASTINPKLFKSLGPILMTCLFGVIVAELIMILLGGSPRWFDLLVAILFCGYIGYDWARAQEKPKTLDNAVDSAVDLYLGIINLFIRLLGKGNKD